MMVKGTTMEDNGIFTEPVQEHFILRTANIEFRPWMKGMDR
jgi:hypothetical protein